MALVRRAARDGAPAHPARGRPAVRRGRRPALVVAAGGPGRAHAHLRRSGMARLRSRRTMSRRPATGDPRRAGAVPRRPSPAAATMTSTSSRPSLDEAAIAVRALRPGLDRSLGTGRARPAADGHRRLERRHEPRRRGGQGRERVARLVPACTCSRVCADRRARGDPTRAERWRAHAATPRRARSRRDGWDGDWYRRAYFDDGTPLGSAANDECRIDSIAQSWAVISGAAIRNVRAGHGGRRPTARSPRRPDLIAAVHAAVRQDRADPGYIKGYPPGIRENGGQYTHAAAWSIMGFAALGRGDGLAEPVLADQPHQPRRHARRRVCATRSSPTSWPPMSIPCRRMSGGAAGPGTRDRPAGCYPCRNRIDPGPSPSKGMRSSSIPASPAHGRAST